MDKLKRMFLMIILCGLFVASGHAQVDTNYFKVKWDPNKGAYSKVMLKRPVTVKDSTMQAEIFYELKQGPDSVYITNPSASIQIVPPVVTANVEINDTCSSYIYNVVTNAGQGTWSELGISTAFKWSIMSDSALMVSSVSDMSVPTKIVIIPAGRTYTSLDWWGVESFANLYIRSQNGGLVTFHLSINGR